MRRVLVPLAQALSRERLYAVLAAEGLRSRARVTAVRARFPAAEPRDVARHLMTRKRRLGVLSSGAAGLLGALSIPPSLALTAWLELSLLLDVATAYGLDVRRGTGAEEVLALFASARGVSAVKREGPRLLGQLGAPVSAWMAGRHLQQVGEAAVRHFEGFRRLQQRAAP
ncbi:MAG: hypothetical protein FJ086_02990 [Deltaproteobacteria bacterium]|nr:hypothetical protein [Deltaproteobacteria bacterium]